MVAWVAVANLVKRRSNVEDAERMSPTVVVGAREMWPSEFAALSSNVFPNPPPERVTVKTPALFARPVPRRFVKCSELIPSAPTFWVPVVVASVDVEYLANMPSNVLDADVVRMPTVEVGEREIWPREFAGLSSNVFPNVAPDWVVHPDPETETVPWFDTWRQFVVVFPRPVICKREVEAFPVTVRFVVVDCEEVEYLEKRRSKVLDAERRSPTEVVGEIEMWPVEFAALNAKFEVNWVPHASFPVVELYWRNVRESSHHPRPVWKRPFDTVSLDVDACPVTEMFVVVAWVEVEVREVRKRSEDDAGENTPPDPT